MTDKPKTLEGHVHTMLAVAVIGMLSWVIYSVNQLQQLTVRQEERLISALSSVDSHGARIAKSEEDIVDLRIKVDRLERRE